MVFKRLVYTLIIILAFTPAACIKGAPTISPLEKDAVILAFGNSLTFGNGARNPENAYPAVLESLIGRKVINAGVPGEVTADGLERLPGLLDKYRPALLILCHGGNDLLRKLDEDRAAENLTSMIMMAKDRGIDVVMLGVPRLRLTSMSAAGFYNDVAEEFNIPYDNDILFEIVSNASLKSDYIHPNVKGYRMMAETVAELLVEAGAIEKIKGINEN